jgi:hypothetical protein
MTPQQFIVKWQKAELSERSAAQQPFLDLCELLQQPKPAEDDPEGRITPSSAASASPTAATPGPMSG